jgi:hypothetical protein
MNLYYMILSLYERGNVRHKINYLTFGPSIKTLIFYLLLNTCAEDKASFLLNLLNSRNFLILKKRSSTYFKNLKFSFFIIQLVIPFFLLWRCGPTRVMASLFLSFLDHTQNDASQSVGLLWMSDQLIAETSIWLHKILTIDKHPCLRLDFFFFFSFLLPSFVYTCVLQLFECPLSVKESRAGLIRLPSTRYLVAHGWNNSSSNSKCVSDTWFYARKKNELMSVCCSVLCRATHYERTTKYSNPRSQ